MFSLTPYTLAGFEPGSSVSEADAMSSAPGRHQGIFQVFAHICTHNAFHLRSFVVTSHEAF
jgi:hypothetical protein